MTRLSPNAEKERSPPTGRGPLLLFSVMVMVIVGANGRRLDGMLAGIITASIAPASTAVVSTQTASASRLETEPEIIGWLAQGNAKNYPLLKERFDQIPNTKFFYHSFDAPCDGCIYKQKTSFAEGRHLVLQQALQFPTIKYFVMIDDDVHLICGNELKEMANEQLAPDSKHTLQFPENEPQDCWSSFNQMLLHPNTTHPFVKPLYTNLDLADTFSIKHQTCSDECFKAFHRDYTWFFYPQTYKLESQSWWLNGQATYLLAQRCWKYAWRVDGNYGIVNPEHRSYPRTARVIEGQPVQGPLLEVLDYTYPELGPWELYKYKNGRCDASEDVSNLNYDPFTIVDPFCEKVLKARYQRWLDGNFEPNWAKSSEGIIVGKDVPNHTTVG